MTACTLLLCVNSETLQNRFFKFVKIPLKFKSKATFEMWITYRLCNAPMRLTIVFIRLLVGFRFCQIVEIFILFQYVEENICKLLCSMYTDWIQFLKCRAMFTPHISTLPVHFLK